VKRKEFQTVGAAIRNRNGDYCEGRTSQRRRMIARCEKERRDEGIHTDMMEYRYV